MRSLLDVTPVVLGIANMIVYVRMAVADEDACDSGSASMMVPKLESKYSGGQAEKDGLGEERGEIV